MPLLHSWSPAPEAQAAIWRIEEPEAFFTARTGLHADIRHGQRRMEYLAGRFLVQHLWPEIEFAEIFIGPNGKPQAPATAKRHFSISHSFPYVAAVVTRDVPCGIDIQVPHPRIADIRTRFLAGAEAALFRNDDTNLMWAWSAKEAVYKWADTEGLQLLRDIEMKYFCPCSTRREAVFVVERLKKIIGVKGWIEDAFTVAVALP